LVYSGWTLRKKKSPGSWIALGEITQRGCGISILEIFKILLDKAMANLI